MSVCVARAYPTNDHNGVKFAVRSRSAEWPLAAQLRRPDMPLRRAAFHPTQPPMTADANGSFGATPAIGDRVVTVRYAPISVVHEGINGTAGFDPNRKFDLTSLDARTGHLS